MISVGGGYLLFNAANQEWLEGPLALRGGRVRGVADGPHVADRDGG